MRQTVGLLETNGTREMPVEPAKIQALQSHYHINEVIHMKYCRTQDGRNAFLIATSVIFLTFVILVIHLRNLLRNTSETDYGWFFSFAVFSIVFFIVLLLVMCVILLWKHRKYELHEEYISVAYFTKLPKLIPWENISEVAVCRVHFSTRGGWDTVIRIVVGHEKCGPREGYGPWSYQRYSLLHQNRIIIIDYTETKMKELADICPLPIRDYR